MALLNSQRNIHCFSPFPNTKDNRTVPDHLHPQDGTIKSILFPPFPVPAKRDPGGIGFLDDLGGSVDGLMSCTESLGFESSDERRVDDQTFDEMCNHSTFSKSKREHVRTEAKKFPPPLSSLDHNGKPTFFLRPVRKDGKLELREVRISRPEILCASRQDGRLRLHLVCSDEEEDEDEEDDDDDGDFEEPLEEGEGEIIEESDDEEVEEIMEPIAKTGEEGGEGWWIPVSPGGGSGGGDGFRRCHEVVRHHGSHHHRPNHGFHVWSSRHCVTIR